MMENDIAVDSADQPFAQGWDYYTSTELFSYYEAITYTDADI